MNEREMHEASKLMVEETAKNIPIDENATEEERDFAKQEGQKLVEATAEFVSKQLSVVKALDLLPQDAESYQITDEVKTKALSECQRLFGTPNLGKS